MLSDRRECVGGGYWKQTHKRDDYDDGGREEKKKDEHRKPVVGSVGVFDQVDWPFDISVRFFPPDAPFLYHTKSPPPIHPPTPETLLPPAFVLVSLLNNTQADRVKTERGAGVYTAVAQLFRTDDTSKRREIEERRWDWRDNMLQASNWPSFQIAIAFSCPSLFRFCNIMRHSGDDWITSQFEMGIKFKKKKKSWADLASSCLSWMCLILDFVCHRPLYCI